VTDVNNEMMAQRGAADDFSKHRSQASYMDCRVVIEPGEGEVFVAVCPSLPGCTSQGRTPAEALANIKDAMTRYLGQPQETRRTGPPAIS
jgi:antitoxin HicB